MMEKDPMTVRVPALVLLGLAATAALPAAAQSAAQPPAAATAAPADGVGVVRAVNPKARTITLDHEAIPSLGWPAMTMTFKVADAALLQGVSPGARVRFQLSGMTVVAITPL
jgi:Cu/Ag efflux protein CusF